VLREYRTGPVFYAWGFGAGLFHTVIKGLAEIMPP